MKRRIESVKYVGNKVTIVWTEANEGGERTNTTEGKAKPTEEFILAIDAFKALGCEAFEFDEDYCTPISVKSVHLHWAADDSVKFIIVGLARQQMNGSVANMVSPQATEILPNIIEAVRQLEQCALDYVDGRVAQMELPGISDTSALVDDAATDEPADLDAA